jgi:hypothetical protein
MSLLEQMQSDAKPVDRLERVAELVKLASEQAAALERANADAAIAKTNLGRTLREDLPELMRELTLTELKLEDGTEVEVRDEVDCGITETNREKAHEWLREHGFGGLIKAAISVYFGTGEEELMEETLEVLKAHLEDTDKLPEVLEAVHPGTLKAFIKERRAAAAEAPNDVPPTDLFGIFPYSVAKVKPPKAPKPPKVSKAKKAG